MASRRWMAQLPLSVPLLLIFAFTIGTAVAATAYPSRPIDFIVPWGSGGGADYIGRALAREMEPILRVSLPVVNVPGGTGQTGLNKMGYAPADGYMMEVVTSETLLLPVTAHPLFDLHGFTPLGIVDQQNPGVLVGPKSTLKDWTDVVDTARKRPVSIAFDGFGSTGDLLVSYLNRHLGTQLNLVPYEAAGSRIASVLGGENELLFTQPGDVQTYIKGGQLRPLLIFAEVPDRSFPDVPISRTFDYPSLIHFRAVYVRAGTPPDIKQVLQEALAKAVTTPSYKSALEQESALAASLISAEDAEEFIGKWQVEAEAIKKAR
jgi:tripartite-type tricarboxylate transporter receptor subunit TctC